MPIPLRARIRSLFEINSGIRTITPTSPLPNITDPVVIDATTQPGFAGPPLIELNGNNISDFPNTGAFNILSGNTTIKGFVINHFRDRGISISTAGGNHIEGNYIGTDITGRLRAGGPGSGISVESPNNVIGGSTPNARNVISGNGSSGITIAGFNADGNIIQGNYIGIDSTGTSALGNDQSGILLGTSNNTVGGTTSGARNVISGNSNGIMMLTNGTSGNLIQGNYVGTDVSGQNKIENSNCGIAIFNSSNNNVIGGTVAGARNVVSGNSWGICIIGSSGLPASNVIQGNYVGLAADGKSPLGNRVQGISVSNANNTTIGGGTPGSGNTIAFNGPTVESGVGTGLDVLSGENHTIRGNSIFSNGRLGIDLGSDGVTNNDSGDGDSGPNFRQNFPVITNVTISAGSANIQGTLNSVANTNFQLDFYANSVCDSGGFGEGARWLGSAPVTTSAVGDTNFNLNFSVSLTAGQVITATATDPSGNTSEFSQCSSLSSSRGSVGFVSTSVTVNEGDGTAFFALTRTGGNVGPISVDYAVTSQSATEGNDFPATHGTVTFADGETSKTFSVPVIDDSLDEPTTETAKVSLSSSGDLDVISSQGVATLIITDNDPTPAISIADLSANEGDSGTSTFNFHVTLASPSAQEITWGFFVSDGTATRSNNDYSLPLAIFVTFAPGQTEATISVPVNGDTVSEPNETFLVNLYNPMTGDITGQAVGTILNDDAVPAASLSINDVSINEGNSGTTDAVFTVALSGPSTQTVTADLHASDVTATAGTDFQNAAASLTFSPGQTVQTFTVHVIGDDIFEGNETFQVSLSNVVNAGIDDAVGVGTIVDDESQPTLSVNNITAVEGDSGTSDAVFTITLSGPSAFAVNFMMDLTDGTAKIHEDVANLSGGVSIPAGETARNIRVRIIGDTLTEGDETFFLNISNPNHATIADGQGTCTIQDNEGPASPPTFQFTTQFNNVDESAGSVEITVSRTGSTATAATVQYETSPVIGTGVSDRTDYTLALGTLQFDVGETTKKFTILLTDDGYVEDPEDFFVSLSNPTGGESLGQPRTSTVTIFDNDTSLPVANPIDAAPLFVRQHYHDFLNREPDPSGFAFWQNEITQCGTDTACIEAKRINVSAAFFLSIEFQETGYLVYRMYKSGFGNLAGAPVPVRFREFIRDTQQIGQGVQVGVGNWQEQLESNKQSYALSFVQQPAFLTALPNSLTADQFVTQLDTNAGGVLSPSEKADLVSQLGTTPSDITKRAQVLRAIAEDQDLKNAEFNKAFVLMQYFGYLRRNPDDAPDTDYSGYNFWLDKLNQFEGNFVSAEMVKAFIVAGEYRQRFGF
ncbi:MAG TPA: Calx-beta domain-containing protein [Pyrinomonadaceae bacterium]